MSQAKFKTALFTCSILCAPLLFSAPAAWAEGGYGGYPTQAQAPVPLTGYSTKTRPILTAPEGYNTPQAQAPQQAVQKRPSLTTHRAPAKNTSQTVQHTTPQSLTNTTTIITSQGSFNSPVAEKLNAVSPAAGGGTTAGQKVIQYFKETMQQPLYETPVPHQIPRPGFRVWEQAPQKPLSKAVRQQLTTAAQSGRQSLMEAVRTLSYYHPEMAEAIVTEATSLSTAMGSAVTSTGVGASAGAGGTASAGASTATASSIAGAATMGSSGMVLTAGGAAALAGAGVAAFSFEGTGDSGGPASIAPPVIIPGSSGDPTFTADVEFFTSTGLFQVGADDAYDRSTGTGANVAVLDTGIDADHAEFIGQLSGDGLDLVAGAGTATTDFDGHGTHVSGIIAAARDGIGVHGVAYNTTLTPYRVFTDVNTAEPDIDFATAITDAATNAGSNIINNSWGTTTLITDIGSRALYDTIIGPSSAPAFENAINNQDVAVVFAAGNESETEVSASAGQPLFYPGLEDNWLVVVSVDGTNALSGFSNQCGIAQTFCIAAPGTTITSTLPYDIATEDRVTDGLGVMSGTSMAAPHVSGALALLLDQFLGLTTQQAISILKTTATDLGAAGVDSVFGNGLLNLDAAFTSVGALGVPVGASVSAARVDPASSSLSGSAVFGSSFNTALKNTNVIVLDSFDRAFSSEMSGFVTPSYDRFDSGQAFTRFVRTKPTLTKWGENASLGFQRIDPNSSELSNDPTRESKSDIRDFQFTAGDADASFTAYYNNAAWAAFGAYDISDVSANTLVIEDALANGYLSLFDAENSLSFVSQTKLGKGTFKLAAVYGHVDSADNDHTGMSTLGEYGIQLSPKWYSAVHFGAMMEDNGLFGATGDGAFSMGRGTTTYAGLSFNHNITDNTQLLAQYQFGVSSMQADNQSLISDFSNVTSNSFSLGITQDNLWSDRDQLGISISQPLRVSGGQGQLTAPTARDASGNIIQQNQDFSLSPSGREINVQTWYTRYLGTAENDVLKIGAAYRHEPGHIADAPAEALGMFQFKKRF